MGVTAPLSIIQGQVHVAEWSDTLAIAGLALSMTVNTVVTGLIVFRIFRVWREVKAATADDQVTGGSTIQRVMFIIIEFGMALFSVQLTRLVTAIMTTDAAAAATAAYYLLGGIHVIIRSVIATLFY